MFSLLHNTLARTLLMTMFGLLASFASKPLAAQVVSRAESIALQSVLVEDSATDAEKRTCH